MDTNLKYILKIWLTGLLLSPFFIAAWLQLDDITTFGFIHIIGSFTWIVFLLTFFDCLFSLPSLLLLGVAVSQIGKWAIMTNIKAKITLSVIGVVLTIAPFMLLTGESGVDDLGVFMLTYVAVIVASIWFYKFQPHAESNDAVLDERITY